MVLQTGTRAGCPHHWDVFDALVLLQIERHIKKRGEAAKVRETMN
jgi:hypothetical protein